MFPQTGMDSTSQGINNNNNKNQKSREFWVCSYHSMKELKGNPSWKRMDFLVKIHENSRITKFCNNHKLWRIHCLLNTLKMICITQHFINDRKFMNVHAYTQAAFENLKILISLFLPFSPKTLLIQHFPIANCHIIHMSKLCSKSSFLHNLFKC